MRECVCSVRPCMVHIVLRFLLWVCAVWQTARADADRAKLAEARALRRQRQLEARLQDVQGQYDQLQAFNTGGGTLLLDNGAGTPTRYV